jgi:hypothetical protein
VADPSFEPPDFGFRARFADCCSVPSPRRFRLTLAARDALRAKSQATFVLLVTG